MNVRVGSSSCSAHEAGHSVTVIVLATCVAKNPNALSAQGPGVICCRRRGPPSAPLRSTMLIPGFSVVTTQKQTPASKTNEQLRHAHRSPKRSEQNESEGQPVSMAGQAIGSSPGVHGMKPLSRESATRASSVGVGVSSASAFVSALASTTSPSGASVEQEIWIATVKLVTGHPQYAQERRDRARLIADSCSAMAGSALCSAKPTFAPSEDRNRAM